MKVLQATSIVGAIAFTGVIFQIGRNMPDATLPGAMPEAAVTLGAPAPSAAEPEAFARSGGSTREMASVSEPPNFAV
jgi:hypothetical protein